MKIKVDNYTIEITHPEKIICEKSNLTKKDLIDYYLNITPLMMPHLNNRPISMQRFPDGIDHEGFFQKDASDYFPTWVSRQPISKKNGDIINYVVINKPATLIYLVNQHCITPHIWLSRIDNLNKPDRMIFDLDPADELSFAAVQDVAQKLKKLLDILELPSWCMLTGSRGAHIIVPLKRIHRYDEVRDFAHTIAKLLAQKFPQLITVEMHKSQRGTRVFLDWLRNGYSATTVAPYAVRGYPNAPVAMPVTWEKLLQKNMTSQKYTIKNALKHIDRVGDIWHDIQKHAISLKKAMKKYETITKDF